MIESESKKYWAGISAFVMWGLFPIYWKLFPEVPSFDLFIARLFWSCMTLIIILIFKKEVKDLFKLFLEPQLRLRLFVSGILISMNWLIYIYAVNSGHILETSLGYFLNPLINVLMGYLILKEDLRKTQIPSLLLAFIGIIILAFDANLGSFPWIALSLSLSFAAYGLIRKVTHVSSLLGLSFETIIVSIGILIYCLLKNYNPISSMESLTFSKNITLAMSGLLTCIPLILFAYAAKRLPLRTLGFIQYLSPSLKFLCGWYFFSEPLSNLKWMAFIFIWLALIYYSFESIWIHQKKKAHS
jgi:chloramphenicol-sensitive protein RarD